MLEKMELKIELLGDDAEKIVQDWVESRMATLGHKLTAWRRADDAYWPDTVWIGAAELPEPIKG